MLTASSIASSELSTKYKDCEFSSAMNSEFIVYLSFVCCLILLGLVTFIKASSAQKQNYVGRQSFLQTYKSAVLNEEDSAIDHFFMPEYKLYHMRNDLTWGSYFPGRFNLLASLAFCTYAAVNKTSYEAIKLLLKGQSSNVDQVCPSDQPLNKAMGVHLAIVALMTLCMAFFFLLSIFIKVCSLASFGLCPMFKYRV